MSTSSAANDEFMEGFSEEVALTVVISREDHLWQMYLNEHWISQRREGDHQESQR